MSKQLSLKLRPTIWDEVAGQTAIVAELKNRSTDMSFPQAMLFSGTTGVGKTTLAFIVAKLLNCTEPVELKDGSHLPCNTCASCQSVNKESFAQDIIMVDAGKVAKSELISLEETVSIRPMYSRNKVIIVEEVQEMFTKNMGTLLKLIEKKRDNVYFIFTTMDAKKVNSAVIGRCQHYKLRDIAVDAIAEHLYTVLDTEGILNNSLWDIPDSFLTEGLFTIAENSGSSIRNALQYLERALYGHFFTAVALESELGFVSNAKVADLVMLLLQRKPNAIDEFYKLDSIEEFFYISWRVLWESRAYGLSKVPRLKWREKYYKKIAEYDNEVQELLRIYDDTYQANSAYFKEDVYMMRIVDYLSKSAIPKLTKVSPPVRQPKRG